jgi:hypothetical protein
VRWRLLELRLRRAPGLEKMQGGTVGFGRGRVFLRSFRHQDCANHLSGRGDVD